MWQEQYESDNIYEGEIRYENNQVVFQNLPIPPQRETSLQQGNERGDGVQQTNLKQEPAPSLNRRRASKRWTIANIIFLIIIIILLIPLLIQVNKHNEKTNTANTAPFPPKNGHKSAQEIQSNLSASLDPSIFAEALDKLVADRKSVPMKSCKELRRLGFKADGIYYIQIEETSYPTTEVFCDMASDGGGWTLVASIHESNISQKCDVNDLWSTYDSRNVVEHSDKTNWESENVFGNLHKCVKNDYKNAAYHNLQASDIMVWHVDPKFSLSSMKQNAYLRYRTNNRFLERHGGNLKTLYEQHYPLKFKESENPATIVLKALAKNAWKIRTQIPDWYDYTYGDDSSNVKDSGMYSSYGNRITITGASAFKYEQKYDYTRGFIDSMMSKPFILINIIKNEESIQKEFFTQIESYRPIRNEDYTILSNNISSGNYRLQYHALQYSSPNIPTPCEFHFVVSSDNWGSAEPPRFWNSYHNNPSSSTYRVNTFKINGYPTNIVMGYMLLARATGENVTLEQADQVAKIVLESLMTLSELFNENRLAKVSNALAKKSGDIVEVIPDWYSYRYSKGRTSRISDNNLYDSYGNQVTMLSSRQSMPNMYYGRIYGVNDHRNMFQTKSIRPFIMINVISNEDRAIEYFITKIVSQRKNHQREITSQIESIILRGNLKIQYKLIQFSYLDQPTTVQFHFVLSNVGKWRSVEPLSTKLSTSSYYRERNTDFKIDGSPSNIVMGYLLLARQNGTNVTSSQSDAVARIVLDAIASVDSLFNEYPGRDALTVPVRFDKGSVNDILNMIPSIYKRFVNPGYLQFRAYNFNGYPNALCPGVKVKSQSPEYSCIGGLSDEITKYGTCGDFAGWGGSIGDIIAPLSANGSAHSQRDLSSAILIFYR